MNYFGIPASLLMMLAALTASSHCYAELDYREETVQLNSGIKGSLAKPANNAQVPAVLMLHGFGSNRDEVGKLYQRLAAALTQQGIASLRIDFRGWGESAGRMEESSVLTEVQDAATAYSYLKSLPWVEPARIGVVGFSLGGGIAVVSAAQQPERYAAMVTWSSVGDFESDFKKSLGQENFDLAAQNGAVTIDLGWRKVTLGQGFFSSLSVYDLQKEITRYPGAFLAIAGGDDFSSAYTNRYVANAAGMKKEAVILEGTDHIFGVLGDDQNTAEQVIQKTVEWFKSNL